MPVRLLTPAEAVRFWPEVERCLSGTLDLVKDTHQPTDVLASILRGEMQLFIADDERGIAGATVGHFMFYPRMKAYVPFLVGGERMPEWIGPMCEAVEAFARAQGCGRMEAGGRAGWVRSAGYEKAGVSLVKRL